MATPQLAPHPTSIELPADLPMTEEEEAAQRGRVHSFLLLLLAYPPAAIGSLIFLFFIIIAIIGPTIAPYDPLKLATGPISAGPDAQHWLGTTRTGQDLFSQLIVGTRLSLLMAIGAGTLATIIATFVGLVSGYLRGWVDDALSTLINVFLILPMLPLLIVLSAYAAAFDVRGPVVITLVIALVSWPWGARAMRSQMLALRRKDFVLAARASGESWIRIVFTEVMPNMLSIVVANLIFATLAAFVAEIGLEFIGLGDTSAISWGSMLYWAQVNASLIMGAWYWFIPPGICIGIFALGLVLINYALDELSNPRLRVERAQGRKRPTKPARSLPRGDAR